MLSGGEDQCGRTDGRGEAGGGDAGDDERRDGGAGVYSGGNVYSGMIMDFVKPGRVTLYFGRPIRFDDLKGRHKDEARREVATQRIMDGITSAAGSVRDQSGAKEVYV